MSDERVPGRLDEVTAAWRTEGACTGECCRLITLNAPPETVAVLAAGTKYRREHPGANVRWSEDATYVVGHFVFVRMSYYDGVTGERRRPTGGPEAQYRCLSWDGRTKRCTDYESRPGLCSRHGVETLCERKGCTLRGVRETTAHHRWADDGGRV